MEQKLQTAASSNKNALELRLELLERRFTMPLPINRSTDDVRESVAPLTSSTSSTDSNQNYHRPGLVTSIIENIGNESQHTFQFDSPTLSYRHTIPGMESGLQLSNHSILNQNDNGFQMIYKKSCADTENKIESPVGQLSVQSVASGKNKTKRLDVNPAEVLLGIDNSSSHSYDDENLAPAKKINKIRSQPDSYMSPLQLQSQNHHSRDNERYNKSTRRSKATTPVKSNLSMYNFFPTIQRQKSVAKKGQKEKLIQSNKCSMDCDQVNTETKDKQMQDQCVELGILRKKCQELEQFCLDKDQQLKAVTNNRTILDSALRTALQQRVDEIKSLKNEKEAMQISFRTELEKFVRLEASQRARELREKLAAEGARLGRIVFSRAGSMIGRSSHLEIWEEGHATKDLLAKRAEISTKQKVLQRRLELARNELMRLRKESERAHPSSSQEFGGVESGTVGHSKICTTLDAIENIEAAQVHLSHLQKQEKELAIEEQALNEQKGAHIRALKRVANEDASRFRHSPKLNDRYVLQDLLGKGGFSEVWRAYDLAEMREVAVKIHQLDPCWPEAKKENYTKHVSREYEIHRNVRHPRIVSLFDVFEIDNNSFATVLECCNGTDLDTMLKIKRRLPETDARFILLQILAGMNYLSQPSPDGTRSGIIHYDLKPGNILFDEYGDAKITDFGLSKIIDTCDPSDSMELTSQGAGTYWYLPPECFLTSDNIRISNKVDVWSIGVIYYQMLFGRRPFGDGLTQDNILSNQTVLNARDVTFPDTPEVSQECKQFLCTCLTYDQSFRPNISQLCENQYIIKTQNDS